MSNKLDELSELYAKRDLLNLKQKAAEDAVITPEIQAELSLIRFDFNAELAPLAEQIAETEAVVKEQTLTIGETQKGQFLQAVYMSGRVSWDTKGLEGLAIVIPEINNLKKVGEPSVSIRSNKKAG
jgi:hypothetical protein